MKNSVICLLMFVNISVFCQSEEQKMFIELYKKNYIEWISSPEIALLQQRDPELKSIIDKIPLKETQAFKDAIEKTRKERKGKESADITDILTNGTMDISMDVIKEFVSKENTDVIINLYWKVIQSAESKEIVDLIIPHIQKAREEFEKAGVEIAQKVSKN